jgi:hypothetical protein
MNAKKLLEAHAAMLAADAAHREMYGKDREVKYSDPDQEKYIRYEVEKSKRCKAAVAATAAFQNACLAFAEHFADEQAASEPAELERAHG